MSEPTGNGDRKGERSPLSPTAIVDAAVALADAEGLRNLTMRNLAAGLGFEVMSLYNHVANKNELLALMVESVATEIDEPGPEQPPLDAVRAIAVSTRQLFVTHPWAAELWLDHLPGLTRTRQIERLLALFAASDLSPELAHHGFHAVSNHVLGYTLQDRGMTLAMADPEDPEAKAREFLESLDEEHPNTAAHVRLHLAGETSSSFELVLDLILDGLVRLNPSDG